jgi:anti-anti-sigma regulatory factor
MDAQKLRPFLDAVKQNPQDHWCWMQLGMAAKTMEDWSTAYCAYLTAIRLRSDNEENVSKFCEARSAYLNTYNKEGDELYFDVFKLPQHTAVFLLMGMLNTKIEPFQEAVKALLAKGFSKIILDFSGTRYISGLGPSCLRNLCDFTQKHGGAFAIICQKPDIRNILTLKKIQIPEYQDITEAFAAM